MKQEKEPIYGDNQGAIPNNYNRSKHINIKYNFIREKFNEQLIDIIYTPSNENATDLFTKALKRNKLEIFHKILFGTDGYEPGH